MQSEYKADEQSDAVRIIPISPEKISEDYFDAVFPWLRKVILTNIPIS